MTDRRIYGRTIDKWFIVRYEPAGKWFMERDARKLPIDLPKAVELATQKGSHIYFDQPGGRLFDSKVKRVMKSTNRKD